MSKVVVFAGSAGVSVRPYLLAAAGQFRNQLHCCSVAEEIPESEIRHHVEEVWRESGSPVRVIVVAGRGARVAGLARCLQVLSESFEVRVEWLGDRSFTPARRFLGRPVDRDTALRYLAAAFALGAPSRMGALGFDGYREERPDRACVVAVEVSTAAELKKRAAGMVESALANEIYPEFSGRVRELLARRAEAVRLPLAASLPRSKVIESLLVYHGARSGSLASMKGALPDGELALAVERAEVELANVRLCDAGSEACLDQVLEVCPLPVFRWSSGLRATEIGRRVEAAVSAAIRETHAGMLRDFRERAGHEHRQWCPPNLSETGLAQVVSAAMEIEPPGARARVFCFTPPEASVDDRDELWPLPETVCHLSFLEVRGDR